MGSVPISSGTYTYYWRERHVGLDGNDYLDGGSGDDQMWGGGGNDHLVDDLETDYPPELINLVPVSRPAYCLAA